MYEQFISSSFKSITSKMRLLQKNFIIAVLIIIVMCIYHICGTNNEHKSEYKYLIKFVGNRRVDIIIKFVLPVIPDQR